MGWWSTRPMALATLINFLIPCSVSVDPNCNFYQDLNIGQQYYAYNQEYPRYYQGATSCQWVARSQPNTKIVLSCEVELPASYNCQNDRLAVSPTGNTQFTDAHNYCGKGNFTHVSEANSLALGLFAPYGSYGGRFLCSMAVVESPDVNCNCGWKSAVRIIGGQETGIHEFPAMAGLIDFDIRELLCGANIISNRYALTAAHCVYRRVAADFGLLVGDHNISSGTETNTAVLHRIEHINMIDSYDSDTQQNDIAIVRTSTPIQFTAFVGPICLPFLYTTWDFYGETVTAMGWGVPGLDKPKSDTLLKVNLRVISNDECAATIPVPTAHTQICTYTPGKDACLSDSGGPLVWQEPRTRRLQLVGLISYGMGCANTSPGVNTRVTSYLPWIVAQTPDAVFCVK